MHVALGRDAHAAAADRSGRRAVTPDEAGLLKSMNLALKTLAAIVVLALALPLCALEVPASPTQWVTDAAGILQPQELQALNSKLREFETRSGAQFIIYIFPSLENESLEDFSIRAAEAWKAGQEKYDNGLILLVFMAEQRVRIEVGYGLEGTMTDAFSSRVIRNYLAPHFQNGQYASGLNAAADAIIAEIEGNEPPVPVEGRRPQGSGGIASLLPLLFIILIFIFVIGPLFRHGGIGGCGGCIPAPIFFPMGGGGSTFGGGRRGGFGGGGFGGGGFGGFSGGGGGFGGGGASGGW